MARGGTERHQRDPCQLRHGHRHPDPQGQRQQAQPHTQRHHRHDHPRIGIIAQPFDAQIAAGKTDGGGQLCCLPGPDPADPRSQDHQRADKGRDDRQHPAQHHRLAKDQRAAKGDANRVQKTDGRHLCHRQPRHGKEPQHHRHGVKQRAQGKQPDRRRGKPRHHPGPHQAGHQRQHQHQPPGKAQKCRLRRRQIGAKIAHDAGDPDKAQARSHHPQHALQRPGGG